MLDKDLCLKIKILLFFNLIVKMKTSLVKFINLNDCVTNTRCLIFRNEINVPKLIKMRLFPVITFAISSLDQISFLIDFIYVS